VPSPRLSIAGHSKAVAIGSSFLFFIINYLSGWPLLRYWNVSGGVFPDSEDILLMGECFGKYGLDIYSTALVDDCHGYWYGSVLVRLLDFFGIGSSLNVFVGFLFFGLLSYTLVNVVWKTVERDAHRIYILSGLLLSPPVLLLAHRGNFDTPIILLVLISILLICRGNFYLANLLIILSAFFKFYTAPLLVLVWLLSNRSRKYLLLILMDIGVLIILLSDLSRVTHFWNGDSFKQAFGIGALTGAINETSTFYISGDLAKRLDVVLLLITLLFLAIKKRNWRIELTKGYQKQFNFLGFLFFGSVALISFLLGSVDYRLLYMGFSILFLCSIYRFSSGENLAIILLSVFALLLSFPSGKLNIYGDAAALGLAAICLYFLLPILASLVLSVFRKPWLYLQTRRRRTLDS
jgi:hypothetical protein